MINRKCATKLSNTESPNEVIETGKLVVNKIVAGNVVENVFEVQKIGPWRWAFENSDFFNGLGNCVPSVDSSSYTLLGFGLYHQFFRIKSEGVAGGAEERRGS